MMLVGMFVIRGSGERYKVAVARDWLWTRADRMDDTGARHLFAALTDMERNGTVERTLSQQAFGLMRGILIEASGEDLPSSSVPRSRP